MEQREIHIAKRHIEEDLLSLKCPRCHAVFVDFNGCFALTCESCKAGFCGWCLADCGNDAHAHVRGCVRNRAGGDLFAPQAMFDEAWRLHKTQAVRNFLAQYTAARRGQILQLVRRQLENAGIPLQLCR